MEPQRIGLHGKESLIILEQTHERCGDRDRLAYSDYAGVKFLNVG